MTGAKVVWFAFRTQERSLLDKTNDRDPAPLGETKTDASGRFLVSIAKPASDISIRIVPASLPSIELDGPFDLTGGEAEDLDVLVPAPEEVSGRVLDEGGKPVASARVRVAVDPSAAEGDGVAYDEAKTAPDGSFVLKNAPKTIAWLTVSRPGFADVRSYRERGKANQQVFLKSGGSIEGSLVDAAGKPVAGAVVVSGGAAAETGEDGRYRMAAVPEGLASVEALWKDDGIARRDGVRVKRGQTATVDLVLARSASIAGTVVDEKTRRPLSGARISAAEFQGPATPPGLRSTTSDARGRFRLTGLVTREYLVVASRRDYMKTAITDVIARFSPPGSALFALRKASTISGRVQDEGGKPVAGARVALVPGRGRRALLETAWARVRPATTTAADGSFRLRGVPPDPAISIEAAKAGFVSARRDGIPVAGGGPMGIALVLRHGFQARGRVVDERSEAVGGVEVALVRSDRYEGGGFYSSASSDGGRPNSTTDAEGRFLVAALERGEYTGRFSRPGFATRSLTLEVQSEGVTEWPPVVLRGSAPVAGVVRNSKGEPISGARVSSFDAGVGASDSCVSDLEGRFRHDVYAAGTAVTLFVSADGYARAQRPVKAPAADLSVVLTSMGTIRGRVEDAETKSPLEGFSLQWHTPGPSAVHMRRDFRSPDGVFELSDVVPGKAEVTASAPGYQEARLAGIEVGEGGEKEGVVLSVRKGKTVTGRVLDPLRSSGVASAIVSWREEGSGDMRGMFYGPGGAFANVPNSTTSDAEGRFRYEGLPSGRLVFSATHPDFMEAARTLDTAADSSVELTLSAGGSIAGQVLGRDQRAPVAGAVVSLQEQGASRSAWTGDEARSDASGRFQFDHLHEGRYRVTARGASGRSPAREIVLAADQRVEDANLELAGGAVIRGRVTGLAANDLSSVRVTAAAKDFQVTAPVGEDGQFIFRDVPAGVLRVIAWAGRPTGRSSSKSVDVAEGASEVPVEIAFEGGSRLSGRVSRGEKGIAGLYIGVTPEPPSGTFRGSAQTDENGRYQMEGLTDGTYRLSISGAGSGFSASRTVTVSGDSAADVVLRGVAVTGVVTDADSGDPIVGASVRAQMTGLPSGASGETDSRGHYSLEDLENGNYQLSAQRHGYQQKTQDVSVGEDPVELDIALSRGSGLVLRAVDGLTGLPLRSLNVLVLSASRAFAFEGSVVLDAAGQGEVPSLAPGRYAISLSSAGYAVRTLQINVPSPTVVVSMTPGGRVEVRADSPLSVRILDSAGNPYFSSRWTLEGVVNIAPPVAAWENFAPGSYHLVVRTSGGDRAYPFTVFEGKTTTVEVK